MRHLMNNSGGPTLRRWATQAFLIGLFLPLGLSLSALAADRHVDIVNRTGETLTHFYASVTSTDDWEEDILGRDTIEDGETFNINIDDGSGRCRYDFEAVFEDGDIPIKNNINVCEISTYAYSRSSLYCAQPVRRLASRKSFPDASVHMGKRCSVACDRLVFESLIRGLSCNHPDLSDDLSIPQA